MGEWISVENEMPEVGAWYLVAAAIDGFGPGCATTMAFLDRAGDASQPCWLAHNDSHCDELAGVTHWMPLPAPPEPHQGRGGGDVG